MSTESVEITLYQGRTTDYQFTIYEDDGSTEVALAATDVVRFKLWSREDAASPNLDLDSVSATSSGSVVTVDQTTAPAKATVRVAQGDASDLIPGLVYAGELSVVDDSETSPTDAIKHVQSCVVHVIGMPGGDVGKT